MTGGTRSRRGVWRLVLWALLAQLGALGEAYAQPARWVSGYYMGYQQSLYPVEEVDFSRMTHIFVGRIRPAADGGIVTDFDIDGVRGPAMARALSARAHRSGRRALLMLGGAGEHEGFVGAASPANRRRFVAGLLRAMDQLGYDGIDVDWEPIEDADRAPLLALLRELRAARPGILLTIPVGWVNGTTQTPRVDRWYAEVASVVNQMNVMTYGMAGAWNGWRSWHHAALAGDDATHPTSVASSIQAYLRAGVPAARLGVGIGFYGSCWRGVTGPRQPLGPSASVAGDDNVMSYAAIRARYLAPAARVWDDAARVPYLRFPSPRGPQGCTFVSYEDEQSVALKGAFVRAHGLGGVMVWTLGQGHLRTAPAGARDPLLHAAYQSVTRR